MKDPVHPDTFLCTEQEAEFGLAPCAQGASLDAFDRLVAPVETDADLGGCPGCGVLTVGHGRRVHEAADAPCFAAVNGPWGSASRFGAVPRHAFQRRAF